MAADGRSLVNRAMAEANNYKSFYGDLVPGHVLAERLGAYTHMFNLYWWVGGWVGGCNALGGGVGGGWLAVHSPWGCCWRWTTQRLPS